MSTSSIKDIYLIFLFECSLTFFNNKRCLFHVDFTVTGLLNQTWVYNILQMFTLTPLDIYES